MELVSNLQSSTQQYNASNLSMDSRILLSRKCIHPHNKQWFKTSMNILDFDEQHRLPYDKVQILSSASLALGNEQRKVLFLLSLPP
ncbi:hypothetical protein TNCT_403531 [Trichonephila clavata]|uniref:Uncharacterized protein n=1 Tax=Trichonephila clavata TaxID=2740835 RepID=A0A8X6LUQ2_TRICU|nr:hypothetical protein TNCT_403531 [Trichonephila clavata]